MTNPKKYNRSLNKFSENAIDGKDLKGGGTPGWEENIDTDDSGFSDPNDLMSGIHHANQLENPGEVTEANDVNDPISGDTLNPLLSPTTVYKLYK
jgi:hypothetical protein